jgi:hypothetical protein
VLAEQVSANGPLAPQAIDLIAESDRAFLRRFFGHLSHHIHYSADPEHAALKTIRDHRTARTLRHNPIAASHVDEADSDRPDHRLEFGVDAKLFDQVADVPLDRVRGDAQERSERPGVIPVRQKP